MREGESLVREKTLVVGKEEITAKNIYINVGTRARIPNIEGIENVSWMDSAGLLDKETVPKHLLILGGGYIGVEFFTGFQAIWCCRDYSSAWRTAYAQRGQGCS